MEVNPLTVFISRILAAVFIMALGWLAKLAGVKYAPDQLQAVAAYMVTWLIPAVLALFSIAKVIFDKKFNPGNASSSGLAAQGIAEAKALKP
jgi:hypothetical protein